VPEYREEYLSEPMAFRPAASGLSSLGRRYGAVLWVLLATLALLVALAATNTASLLAARVVRRRVELGVRAALGATPVRIALPIVLESLVLTGSGAVLGHGVSALCSRLLLASLGATPDAIERASPLELRVVAFAIGLLLLVAVASALVPALKAARIDPLAAMRTAAPLGRRGLAGRLLVANQVSLSLALLIVAGLAIQTFLDLAQRPIGFEGRGLLVARIRADERAGAGPGLSARDLGRRAREAVADLPELEAAGVSSITPLSLTAEMVSWFCDAGDREPATDWVHRNFVSPGWFATYRTRVVAGRSFSDADVLGAPGVAIVNQAFAEAYPCGGPVLGAVIHERTYPDLAPGPPLTVVGIVEDAVYRSYRETAPPALYRPFAQMADPEGLAQPLSLTARPRAPDATSIRKLETTLRALSPAISVEVEPFDRRLDRALLKERLLADLSLAIGLLGGLLAVLGAYAVAALDASGRRREAAIRLALGASDLSIHATQLRRVAVALAIGLACGEALGYALSRIAHSWLGTAAPASTWVYAGAAALLGFATLTAVAVAARGALRMAPSRLLAVADQ
jgi:predicted permease